MHTVEVSRSPIGHMAVLDCVRKGKMLSPWYRGREKIKGEMDDFPTLELGLCDRTLNLKSYIS